MKISFILLLSGFSFASLIAQEINWQDGLVKVVEGRVFNEKISYDPEMDIGLVFAKSGNQVLSLNPDDVIYFTLSNKGEQREYYSLPLTDRNSGYIRNHFFEVLYESKSIALLSRNILAFKQVTNGPAFDGAPTMTRSVPYIDDELYVIDQNNPDLKAIGSESHLFGKRKIDKKIIYSFFEGNKEEMHNYIKENVLNLRKIGDLIRALTYFSKLKDQL